MLTKILTRSMVFSMRTILLLTVMMGTAKAAVVMTLAETPTGVTATGGGSINLTDLTYVSTTFDAAGVNPSAGFLEIAPNSFNRRKDLYRNISGPGQFGSGGFVFAGDGFGDAFGVRAEITALSVPEGYVSGTLLEGAWTLAGASFASLGIEEGTYTWTWGSGANSDSLTINASAVPVPAAVWLFGSGLIGLIGIARRKKA